MMCGQGKASEYNGSVQLNLMDVQSQLLLVFSLHGDADVHVFARCMW
jgi:hypothetical protein